MDTAAYAVVLFDGVCSFCNKAVRFIIRRDRNAYFRFASLQSDAGIALLADHGQAPRLDSIVLVENGRVFTESTAALRIARRLDGWWKAAVVLLAIPKPVRDFVYRSFARRRYRWFGRQESCMLPTPEQKARFLDID